MSRGQENDDWLLAFSRWVHNPIELPRLGLPNISEPSKMLVSGKKPAPRGRRIVPIKNKRFSLEVDS